MRALVLVCALAGHAVAEPRQDPGPSTHHRKNWLRAGLEIGTYLGLGGAWYYANLKLQKLDWEYELNGTDLRRKFTEGIRFDNNPMRLNSPGHPVTGALIHGFARSSGFSELESLGIGAVSSFLWEFLVEYREVISVNDMIFATTAGTALGETMHQLGMFFARSEGSVLHDVLGGVLGGPTRLNVALDGERPRARRTGRFGFPDDLWHQFDVWVSAGASDERVAPRRVEAGFETQILNVPTYGRAADTSRGLTDTVFTQMLLRASADSEGLADVRFQAKAAFAGYYRQHTRAQAGGGLTGYSLFVGGATAYQHLARRKIEGPFDQIAIAHVVGPTVDLTLHHHAFRLRATADVFGDFGAVSSAALDAYEQAGNSLAGTKSILGGQRYYYAYGITIAGRITATYGPFEAGGELQVHRFESIEGHDRVQPAVTNDFHLSDQQMMPAVWLACAHPDDVARLALSVRQNRRSGSIGDVTVEDVETTTLATMLFRF